MRFQQLATVSPKLVPQLQWLWASRNLSSFIVGDERAAFAIPFNDPGTAAPLEAAQRSATSAIARHPVNLPISDALYEEFARTPWRGFRLLPAEDYDKAKDKDGNPVGDLLRTLVMVPDYGHYVLHESSGLVLSLRSGTMQLLQSTADGFHVVDETRTRGRAALAFGAHPTESLVVYGDNYGDFHAHSFSAQGFGLAKKIATKTRKASVVEFIDGGSKLFIAGMGYLAAYAYDGKSYSLLHETSCAVRSLIWVSEPRILFANQGLHGVTAYRYDEAGFQKLADLKTDSPVGHVAVSSCGKYLAVLSQSNSDLTTYAITLE